MKQGISTPDQPNIASTRWRTVADQKNRVYFFESTLNPDVFWINLANLDFSASAPVKKLMLAGGEIHAGNAAAKMVKTSCLILILPLNRIVTPARYAVMENTSLFP